MKFKISTAAILVASLSVMAVIFFMVDRISKLPSTPEVHKEETQDKSALAPQEIQSKTASKLPSLPEPQHDEKKLAADEKIILEIVDLSAAELEKELSSLRKRMKEENLFEKLELKQIDAQKVAETKAILERFTLLGLEQTRRKYVAIEPELSDPLYAHRDSLKDIRGLLARY